jgi:ABC-type multidrug transport system fused ATPase/permease subunit
LYASPDIIVLDEPTAALDVRSERNFLALLKRLRKARTVIIISHRLSTLKDCERLLMFEHGRISCDGSFEQLVKTSPEFSDFINDIST